MKARRDDKPMTTWTMNEQSQQQLAFYTDAVRHAMDDEGKSLHDTVTALFTRDPDERQPAVLRPLTLPEESARMLADCICSGVTDHCSLLQAVQKDPAAAAQQWLDDMTGGCSGNEQLAARYHLISETLRRRSAVLDGSTVDTEAQPYAGGCTDTDVQALRETVLRQAAAIEPSPSALRALRQQLTCCESAAPDGDPTAQTLSSAILFAMRCDGSLPADCDEVMLGELIAAVCMAHDLQKAAAAELADTELAAFVHAAWCTGMLELCGGVIKAGLTAPALLQAVSNAVPAAAITSAAFVLTPAILAAIDCVKQLDSEAVRRCVERLDAVADRLENKEEIREALGKLRIRTPKIRE